MFCSSDPEQVSEKHVWFLSNAGGLSSFKQNHENLCDNSLQLQECPEGGGGGGGAMAVTSTLPQSIPTTPDIENAELTPILPFLFLGNEHDAQDLEKMQRLNIGYIINVTTHLPLYHYEKGLFNYKRLPATDSNKQNLRQYFEEAFEFIGNYLCLGFSFLINCYNFWFHDLNAFNTVLIGIEVIISAQGAEQWSYPYFESCNTWENCISIWYPQNKSIGDSE